MLRTALAAGVLILASTPSFATTWRVGPTRTYTVPSKVMPLVADGDTVEIDAATYSGDVGVWSKNNLLIRGVGGYAHLDAAGANVQGKGIWVVTGANTTIENIEFSGAAVPDLNGAGIRQEGAGLTLRHCYFHDNEDGILTGANDASDILIEACEFARNGHGDGYSHNMYIGHIRSFTLRFSYVHEAKEGHNVKSRALNNYILYNLIADGETATTSFDIDLPNGGRSIVLGNSIMKGPSAHNTVLVNYGEEGLLNADTELYVVNNTMVTERANTTFVRIAAGTPVARIINNIFAGAGTVFSGSADTVSNLTASLGLLPFRDKNTFDYHLTTDLAALHAGSAPGAAGNFLLTPIAEYLHPLDSALRADHPLTIGAFHVASAGVAAHPLGGELSNYPNPFRRTTTIELGQVVSGELTLRIYDESGVLRQISSLEAQGHVLQLEANVPSGIYRYVITGTSRAVIARGSFVVE